MNDEAEPDVRRDRSHQSFVTNAPTNLRRERSFRTPAPNGRRQWLLLILAAAALWTHPSHASTGSLSGQEIAAGSTPAIVATLHPPVPLSLDAMWFAPRSSATPTRALTGLAEGVRLLEESQDPQAALPLVSEPSLTETDVAPYARYYTGVALQRLDRLVEADTALSGLLQTEPQGFVAEDASFRLADVKEARADFAGAIAIYERLLQQSIAAPQTAWHEIAVLAAAMGDRQRAIDAHRKVVYEFPLTIEAADSERSLELMDAFDTTTPAAVAAELGRAQTLFTARRWAPAKAAFTRVRNRVDGANQDLVTMRLAEIEYATGRQRNVRDVFKRYVGHEVFGEEAEFYLLGTTAALGTATDYRRMAREFAEKYPKSPRAEEALNDLATHLIRADEDAAAAQVFVQMLERFPAGRFLERAAWRAGWWAYRQKNYADTIRFFDQGAAAFPRSDYRPSWLYWTARAYENLGQSDAAVQRYRLAIADYRNTYYGRLAWDRLEEREQATIPSNVRRAAVDFPVPPPGADRVARLIQLELYHPALRELQHIQRVSGNSAPLQATIALVYNRLGELRLGINTMKRAYPQFMAAGGERLPDEILRIMFPLDYWQLLQFHSKALDLDPYLVAALVGQESTYDADIRSAVGAIGLMQIMPPTGRTLAKKLGIQPFSVSRLTDPETNVRMGTRYLADLIRRFAGKEHNAIASYNAGEHRVDRWKAEKPGLPDDEFIDDIPFEETRNYVKRILGTAEDYRRLYGTGAQPTVIRRPPPTKAAPSTRSTSTTKKPPAKKAPAKKATTKKPTKKS